MSAGGVGISEFSLIRQSREADSADGAYRPLHVILITASTIHRWAGFSPQLNGNGPVQQNTRILSGALARRFALSLTASTSSAVLLIECC